LRSTTIFEGDGWVWIQDQPSQLVLVCPLHHLHHHSNPDVWPLPSLEGCGPVLNSHIHPRYCPSPTCAPPLLRMRDANVMNEAQVNDRPPRPQQRPPNVNTQQDPRKRGGGNTKGKEASGARNYQGDPESGKPKLCVMENELRHSSWLVSSRYYFPPPSLMPFDPSPATTENESRWTSWLIFSHYDRARVRIGLSYTTRSTTTPTWTANGEPTQRIQPIAHKPIHARCVVRPTHPDDDDDEKA